MDSTPPSRISLVDDDQRICELLSTKLRSLGFITESCGSGEEALELLSNESFDAIISDLNMPGISGFELLAEACRLAPHTAFLMFTGVDDVDVGVAAMKQGAADYITKPPQMEAVVASLRRALEMKRMEAELEEYHQRLESMVEERTKELEAALQKNELTYDETLEALAAALDLRDDETHGHSQRVTLYSLEMAKRLHLSSDRLKQLERAAYLHDIGKIGIRDAILLNPGKLSPEETAIMRTHVQLGYKLMSRVAFLAPAAEIVLANHEFYDGSGYPRGLAGEEIPLASRIFAVADTLDAIMSDRPYRLRQAYSAARAEIERESGRQFDPKVVEVFLAIPEETWLRISSGATQAPSEQSRTSIKYLTAKE